MRAWALKLTQKRNIFIPNKIFYPKYCNISSDAIKSVCQPEMMNVTYGL